MNKSDSVVVSQNKVYKDSRTSIVHPMNIYQGAVFKNCSFGSNPISNMLKSDVSGKSVTSVPVQSRKSRFGKGSSQETEV